MPNPPANSSELRPYNLLGWLTVIAGVVLMAYFGLLCIRYRDFLSHAVHTRGKIVGNWYNKPPKSSGFYTAIFTFVDRHGKSWRVFEPDFHGTSIPTPLDQTCAVVYNPDNPAEAQTERSEMLNETFLQSGDVALIGVVLTIGGAISLLKDRFERPRGDGTSRGPATPASP